MGTISIDHGNHLFWLGRYTERVFTTLKTLKRVYDQMLDQDSVTYETYLGWFGIPNVYCSAQDFFAHTLYDRENPNSVTYSLERAYDNGIVLREEISTQALSFLQMAMDTLETMQHSEKGLALSMLPLEDILYGFWGCVDDAVYEEEIKNIIYCGKCVERLDLYFRMRVPFSAIEREFNRLCLHLQRVPRNTPYRYNTRHLSVLVELMGDGDDYGKNAAGALRALSCLFDAG